MNSNNNDIINLDSETKLRLETTNSKIIYFLENRGYIFLSHFLWFQIGGLRHLDNTKKHIIYIPYMNENLAPSDIDYLLKMKYDTYLHLHLKTKKEHVYINYEILNHIYPNFIFINTLNYIKNLEEYTIINHYGEPCSNTSAAAVHTDTFIYLRNLLLSNYIPIIENKPKRIYISRYKTPKNDYITTRYVINEDNVYEMLKEYNFEKIYLEDYNLKEKIDMFQSAEIIIYPQAGGISALCSIANLKSNMVEFIVPNGAEKYCNTICDTIGINYTKFTDIQFIDNEYNMIIDINSLNQTVKHILNL
jgi:hypothetical protein